MEKENSHFPLLDIVRYFAALLVAVFHYFLYQSNNFIYEYIVSISVEIFFVLSGFVLANQINSIRDKGFRFRDLRTFLLRRWMRTIPPYLIAVIVAIFIFGGGDLQNIFLHILYLQNFITDHQSRAFFSVGWSLSIEEWFYIIFPLTLLIFSKFWDVRNSNIHVSIIIIILCIFCRYYFGSTDNWGQDVRRTVIFRLDAIVVGYLAFCIKEKLSNKNIFVFGILSTILFAVTTWNNSDLVQSEFYQNLFFVSCGLFFSFLLIFLSRLSPLIGNQTGSSFSFLARLSYPIYLFHIILIALIGDIFGEINFLIYIVLLHGFSIVFHYTFEKPILSVRPKYTN